MAATRFELVSEWHLDTPVERIWAELVAPEQWPQWWRAVKRVEVLSPGDALGLGTVRRFTWGTALPYTLTFDMTATRIEPMTLLEARAGGEFDGIGRWTLNGGDRGTDVRYDWIVELKQPWQVALAPVLKPIFTWNHYKVLGWGYEDLKTRLMKTAH